MDLNFVNFNIKICETKINLNPKLIKQYKKIKLGKYPINQNDYDNIGNSLVIYKDLIDTLHPYFLNIIKNYGYSSYKINGLWQQKYNKGDYHDLHCHNVTTPELSFVLFIDCTEKSSNTLFHLPGYPYVSDYKNIEIKPEKNKLIVFPSIIPHQVLKNNDNVRRIISGNLSVS